MAASTMLSATGGILGKKAGSGKSARKRPAQPPIKCPECGGLRIWKDGLRYTNLGPVQRYICRNCAYRFSDPDFQDAFNGSDMFQHVQNVLTKKLKRHADIPNPRQVCVALTEGTKNLAEVETRKEKAAGATKTDLETVKGKILEFAVRLKNNGFADSTIKRYIQSCNTLTSYGANILNPESVKETIAKQSWQDGTKLNYVNFYDTFIKFLGLKWQKPRYKHSRKLPFIPLESEIDLLIHGTGKKISTALQIIKETGMRIGEVMRLRWIDIDTKRNIIALNYAEKHGNNRMFRVSTQLISRILLIPKKSEYVFNHSKISVTSNFYMARKRIAYAYNNPRLLRISFHTIRHWKATTEYHKTKDILHVKNMLGHQSIDNTLIYITMEQTLFGSTDNLEFHVKVAHNLEEACELIKVGFNYVCDMEDCKIFRKRK